jgi:hypothetical protein
VEFCSSFRRKQWTTARKSPGVAGYYIRRDARNILAPASIVDC